MESFLKLYNNALSAAPINFVLLESSIKTTHDCIHCLVKVCAVYSKHENERAAGAHTSCQLYPARLQLVSNAHFSNHIGLPP